jgi:uncharacterized membrane protein YgcG
VAKTFNDLKPVLIFLAGAVMVVAKFITDNLTAVLVTVGIGLLAYYAIVTALTIANFLEAASKYALVASIGTAITSMFSFAMQAVRSAGMMALSGIKILASALMVAGAFLIAIWPITLLVAAIGATVYIFKKFGGDLSVVKDGLMIMWDGFKIFLNYLKLGFLKLLDYIPGVDMDKEIEETEADIAQNKKDVSDRADKIQATMAKNRAAAEAEKLAEEKREREEAARKRKAEEGKNQAKPGMPGSTGFGGMGGGSGGDSGASSAAAIPGMDYNLGGDALLKQFAERQKGSPMAAGDTTRKQLETDGMNKQQAEVAAKAEAAAKVEKEKSPQDSATAQLAELNNKMATLLKYTWTVAHNTNENVSATRGLNNNLYKA